jgi:hypothetical protein
MTGRVARGGCMTLVVHDLHDLQCALVARCARQRDLCAVHRPDFARRVVKGQRIDVVGKH